MAAAPTRESAQVEEEQEVRSRGASSGQNTQLTVTQTLTVSRARLVYCLLLASGRERSISIGRFEQVKSSVKK